MNIHHIENSKENLPSAIKIVPRLSNISGSATERVNYLIRGLTQNELGAMYHNSFTFTDEFVRPI
jgi:hypothetical protein